ncbi:hypothetical protein COOONC_21162 [Cooperia oncophora]
MFLQRLAVLKYSIVPRSPLQNIAALRYVAAVCPTVQAVVKLDDDVAWNIQGIKSMVDESIKMGAFAVSKAKLRRKKVKVAIWSKEKQL